MTVTTSDPAQWSAPRKKHHRIHNFFAILLGLVTCLVFVFAVVSAWFHQSVLVTDRFVGIVGGVTSDPVVIERLSVNLSDQVVERLALQQRIENLLPDQLDRLALPLTEAVAERLASAADRLLMSEQFQGGWDSTLTLLHSKLIAVLRGEAENVQLTNGTLTIDLLAIVQDIIAQLQADGILPTDLALPNFGLIEDREAFLAQLSTAVGAELPPDFGQVQIADANRLQALSTLVQQADIAVVALFLVALILIIISVLFAHRHWRALFMLGAGIEVLIVFIWLGLVGAQSWATDSLASADGRPVLSGFVGELAGSLQSWLLWTAAGVALVAVVAGLFAAIQAWRRY